jgi:sigma-B regulation protein RsbU (phosphoserine phosphatase)
MEVGGDFYDIFPQRAERLDGNHRRRRGEGARGRRVHRLVRHTLRTASMLSPDPAANLSLLNQALHADATGRLHCTACYLRLCPDERGFECRLANAGHPSPLLVREDGRLVTVDGARGPLLGAFPDAEYREETFRLAPGELLLMYTDGVTDVGGADAALRERNLARVVAASAGRSAASSSSESTRMLSTHKQASRPTTSLRSRSGRSIAAERRHDDPNRGLA